MLVWRIGNFGCISCERQPLIVAFCEWRAPRETGQVSLDFGGKKQDVSHDFVDERHRAVVSRRFFINSGLLSAIRKTVLRVRNIFNVGSRMCFLDFQFLAGSGRLCADCKALVFRSAEENGWWWLWKRLLVLQRQYGLDSRCCQAPLFLSHRCPSHTTSMFGNASCGDKKEPSVECAGSQQTSLADVAKDGNVENQNGLFVLVNDDVEAFTANADGDFDQRRDEQVGNVADSGSTTRAYLLF